MKLAATLTPDELSRLVAGLKLPVKNLTAKKGDIEVTFTYSAPVVGDVSIDLEAQIISGEG